MQCNNIQSRIRYFTNNGNNKCSRSINLDKEEAGKSSENNDQQQNKDEDNATDKKQKPRRPLPYDDLKYKGYIDIVDRLSNNATNSPEIVFKPYHRRLFYYPLNEKKKFIKRNHSHIEFAKAKSLFIPEIRLFIHESIHLNYAMIFDRNNFDIHYTFMEKYPEEIHTNQIISVGNISNELYLSLKMILSVATAIEYLNEVHGRVHGNIHLNSVKGTEKYKRVTYKLYDFENSFKLGKNERLKINFKMFESPFASPEESLHEENKAYFFCRKSEVWSIGALLLKSLGFKYATSVNPYQLMTVRRGLWAYYEDIETCSKNHTLNACCLKKFILQIMIYDVDKRPDMGKCIKLIFDRILEEERILEQRYDALRQNLKNIRKEREACIKSDDLMYDHVYCNAWHWLKHVFKAKRALETEKGYTQSSIGSYEFQKKRYPVLKELSHDAAKEINAYYKKICEGKDNNFK